MTSIALLLVLALACAGLAALVGMAIRSSRRLHPNPPPDDDGGGGGNIRRRPLPPRDPSNPGDPPWWPEFERQLAEYMKSRSRSAHA